MQIEEIRIQTAEMIAVTDKTNYSKYIERLHSMVKEYAKAEGNRKLLEQFFLEEYKNLDDDYKEELIGEILSRIADYCQPSYRYEWNDQK